MSQKMKRRRLQAVIAGLNKELEASLQNRNYERNQARMDIAVLERRLAQWMATHTERPPIVWDGQQPPCFGGQDRIITHVECAAVLVRGDVWDIPGYSKNEIDRHVAQLLADHIVRDGLMVRIDDPARRESCFAVAVGKWNHPEGAQG